MGKGNGNEACCGEGCGNGSGKDLPAVTVAVADTGIVTLAVPVRDRSKGCGNEARLGKGNGNGFGWDHPDLTPAMTHNGRLALTQVR